MFVNGGGVVAAGVPGHPYFDEDRDGGMSDDGDDGDDDDRSRNAVVAAIETAAGLPLLETLAERHASAPVRLAAGALLDTFFFM